MELPIFKIYMNFSGHHLCCFTVVLLFLLDTPMGQEEESITPLLQKFV
jgi:hypothetical protein